MISLKLMAQSLGLVAFSASLPIAAYTHLESNSDLFQQPDKVAILDNFRFDEQKLFIKTSTMQSGVKEERFVEVVTPDFETAQLVCNDVRYLGDEFSTHTIMTRRQEIIALNQMSPVEFSFRISERDLSCHHVDRVASL